MGKVTRKKMGRGVELTVDQVFAPIAAMAGQVGSIEAEQMEARYATFRLNFNIPWLGSKYFYDNRTVGTSVQIVTQTTGYVSAPGWYYGVPTMSAGAATGTGLLLDVLVDGAGQIAQQNIYVQYPGSGYTDGDEVLLLTPGGGAAPATRLKLKVSVGADSYDKPFYIPFCLPPLQENIEGAASALAKEGTPFPVLDEVSFSLDQSDEPSMILGQWYGRDRYKYSPARRWRPNPYAGKKTYNRTDAYDFTLSIYEKEQFFRSTSLPETDPFSVGGEAVSINIPSSAFIARTTRFNPIDVGGINRQFDPLKTYCMAIFAPNLHDVSIGREHCVANNIWVSLKFKMALTERDSGSSDRSSDVQNIPLHYGERQPATPTITAPAAATSVIADGTSAGISNNLQLIDQQFSDKLRGGYGEFSQAYPSQNIKDDAAYEVMAVPLGAGFATNRMSARDEYLLAPYTQGSAFNAASTPSLGNNPYIDRRIVPIDGDMTIHHIVVALNWSSDKIQTAYDPSATDDIPTPPTPTGGEVNYRCATMPVGVKYSVGVGMVAGPRADTFGYQQIGYSEFEFAGPTASLATLPNGVIDAISMSLPACSGGAGGALPMPAEWILLSVPIRNQAALAYPAPAENGTGYWGFETTPAVWLAGQQGKPYYVGEGNTYTHERADVGTAAGGAAETPLSTHAGEGCEQFLEVRLAVDPQSDVYGGGAPALFAANYQEGDIFLGYGGCWVYIIGKKHLK
tara:strand:- start:522 stop:2735 length:2214 start_codon:yes stop_codon:yes gene_type:complete